jgi:opacity protein-like surface antigen
MRIKYVTLASVAALLLAPAPTAAQVFCSPTDETSSSDKDIAACLAATTTPFGALPNNIPANWMSGGPTGIGFNVRFGSMDEEGDAGRRNIGIGVEIPAGSASLGFTGGLVDFTCDVPAGTDVECKKAIMLGARFAAPLVRSGVGGTTQSSLILGLNGSVGFSNGDVISGSIFGQPFEFKGRAFSVGLGLPVGLVARSGTVSISPFIEPALFWGQTKAEVTDGATTDSATESGTGFALGGGVTIGFANGVAIDVGFKKVMIDEANAMIGVGVSFQR